MKKMLKKPMKSFGATSAYVTAYGGEGCGGGYCGFNW